MAELYDRVATILRENRERYVDICIATTVELTKLGRGVPFSREEMRQMIDGAIAVVLEGYEGKSSEKRSFYCESLIPTVVEQGAPLEVAAGATSEVHMIMAADLATKIPEHADALIAFYSRFVREFVIDIINAGFTAEVGRRAKLAAG